MANFIKKLLFRSAGKGKEYDARIRKERAKYAKNEFVHELPGIFHYWSNTHLLPELKRFDLLGPDDFFEKRVLQRCRAEPGRPVRVFCPGAGNCDLEARLAKNLAERGVSNFRFDCLDLNRDMLKRGRKHAETLGVTGLMRFEEGDFNDWRGEADSYDVVLANQSLHHVLELEQLFDAVHHVMAVGAEFLISDMIGRNGHMRWPEALEAMQPFWEELPPTYRYNRMLDREELAFMDFDCSRDEFEGIRAQDILPLLCERFGFEFFFPFGNIIFPFIDRSFGHNFDANHDFDRHFIDRVHARDEQALLSHELTPTAMIAVAMKGSPETRLRKPQLTPAACIRKP